MIEDVQVAASSLISMSNLSPAPTVHSPISESAWLFGASNRTEVADNASDGSTLQISSEEEERDEESGPLPAEEEQIPRRLLRVPGPAERNIMREKYRKKQEERRKEEEERQKELQKEHQKDLEISEQAYLGYTLVYTETLYPEDCLTGKQRELCLKARPNTVPPHKKRTPLNKHMMWAKLD